MARFRIVTALLVFAIVALALSLLLVGTVDVPAVEVLWLQRTLRMRCGAF